MATPTTREEFKQFCLRKLGKPVIEINVDDDQAEDRIDEALKFYQDYHYDGSHRTFLKHQITSTDISNEYIAIPSTIIGVINVFPIGVGLNTNNLFNLRYQITLNEIVNWTSTRLANYTMSMERIALMEELLVGKQPLRFNRHMDRMYLDVDWQFRMTEGEYIIIEAYQRLDPDSYSQVWGDWWLQNYASALIKKQWGANLSKFENMQMPGGVIFNGQKIWEEANEDVRRLEDEVIEKYSMPAMDMIS